MKNKILCLLCCLAVQMPLFAQNTRIADPNTLGWYGNFFTFKIAPKWSLHAEYQWRREGLLAHWQQGLFRVGVNYQAHQRLQLRAGYAQAETYNYGDYPLNRLGKIFSENRLYQMANLTDKIGKFDISHRFMLEQRWIGTFSSVDLTTEDDYILLQRARYMLRIQAPFKGISIQNRSFYWALYDEILIGFGNNVNENVFDQHRVGAVVGYRWSPRWRIEAGWIHQNLQLGREIGGRNVYQINNGLVVSSVYNLDFSKTEPPKQ